MKHIYILLCFFLFLTQNQWAQKALKLDSLKQALLYVDDSKLRIELLLNLSQFSFQENLEEALGYAQKATQLSLQTGSKSALIQSYLYLSRIYKNKNDIKQAIGYIQEAKHLAENEKLEEEYAEALYLMARIYVELGEYEKTAELLFEALHIFEKHENNKGIIDVTIMIGGSYYVQGEFIEAEKYLQNSIDLSKKHQYTNGLAKGLTNISAVYNLRDETEKAIEYLRVSFALFQKVGDKVSEGISYSNTALYFLKLNQIDSAFKYIDLSMQVNENIKNQRNLILTLIVSARTNLIVNDTSLFLSQMDSAYLMANRNGYKNLSLNAVNVLLDYFASIEDYESAFRFSQIQTKLKDSLDSENSLTRLSQLRMLYEIEKEEQERKMNEQRKEFIISIVILCLILGLVLLLFFVFRFRVKAHLSKLKQRKLEDELHLKHQELAANVMALMKKNEMLTDINDRLIDIRKKAISDETKNAITKIAFEIENNTQEKIWEEFEMRFKQVHSDFYNKLMRLYPDLTSNEIRLCAFLKLNLSTKEISSITGQSPRSLEVARYRLRKKMNITPSSVNLSTHINQI